MHVQTLQSVRVVQTFKTDNPYRNGLYQQEEFFCNEAEQTVHIRLDQERGFETERGYDYFIVEWDGYFREVHGSIQEGVKSRSSRA